MDHTKHCQFNFGEYVHTHEEHSAGMEARTIGAIATRPTGNDQGTFFFMNILTGRMIKRVRATSLAMPQHVISQVHRLDQEAKDKQGMG